MGNVGGEGVGHPRCGGVRGFGRADGGGGGVGRKEDGGGEGGGEGGLEGFDVGEGGAWVGGCR